MDEIFKLFEFLKDPALVAMVVINYLLIRQNGNLVDMVDRNTKALAEIVTLLNIMINNRGIK